MTTSTLSVLRETLMKEVEVNLAYRRLHEAKRVANKFLEEFIANREEEISYEELERLARALGFANGTDLVTDINGAWGERGYGIHVALEWRRVNLQHLAKVHYIEV